MSFTGPWQGPYTPPADKCSVHPGVKWNGDVPCFVCHPTPEQEGTVEHLTSILPNQGERTQPAVNRCMVLCNPNTEAICGRPGTKTVLGFRICDACYEAVAF